MGDQYLDYDYPAACRPDGRRPPFLSMSCTNLDPSSSYFPTKATTATSSQLPEKSFFKSNAAILDMEIPLDEEGDYSSSCYYDIPKNIPVNPRFANQSPLISRPFKFPVAAKPIEEEEKSPTECKPPIPAKPTLPKKSMAVISKMSTYSNSSTGSSVPKPDHRSSNPNLLSSYPLSKQNTSKPLPLLPDEEEERRKAIENYSFPVEKRSSLIKNSNHKPTTRTSPPAPPPSTALKFTDIYQCQPSEDYEECDYEYDYVCLESKKKLEGDDKKIQNLIPKEMQSKYEQLVLRTFDSLNLNSLEKSLSEKPIDSVNPRIILLYRRYLADAIHHFSEWTNLSIQIIEQSQSPEVFFNFVKHILLSGQTLLLIVKSLCRTLQPSALYFDINDFSIKFFECLKVVVLKTKRTTNLYFNTSYKQDLLTSIQSAIQICTSINRLCLQVK